MIKWHHTFRSQILTTCDTDVPLCPLSTFINIHPPSPPKPITGPSFRWSRGICSLPSMNTNLTGTCGLSDTPEKFSLFDEQKPISVDFLENRPTLAPPSFLQPVEKSTKFYLSEYLWILMQIVDFSRFPAKWYLVTCSRPVCSPGPPPRHLSLPRSPPGSFLPFYVFLSFVFLSFCIFIFFVSPCGCLCVTLTTWQLGERPVNSKVREVSSLSYLAFLLGSQNSHPAVGGRGLFWWFNRKPAESPKVSLTNQ